MRLFQWIGLIAIVGCGTSPGGESPANSPAPVGAFTEPSAAAPVSEVPVAQTRQPNRPVDWSAFLGPTGESKSPEIGILTDWPAAGPPKLWEVRLGEGYCAPTISQGRVFVFDRVEDEFRLRCLQSDSGEAQWEFTYPANYQDYYGYDGGPRSCPVVDGERVYVFGPAGVLHCLKVDHGEIVWKVDTVEKFGVVQNFFGVGSAPVVERDLLLVQVGGSPAESQGVGPGRLDRVMPNGSAIVAFEKRTGEVKYKSGDDLASYSSPKLATIGGRRWCFLYARSGLLGFDPANGDIRFHYPWRSKLLESVNASNPVVVGDEVLISETYGPGASLLKISGDDYKVVWADKENKREKAMQTHWNTPIHIDGYLYGSSGRNSNNAELRCIEWKTGKAQWSQPGLARCSLLYVDGHFLCLGEYGTLRLLRVNPETYDEVARTVLSERDPGPEKRPLRYPAWAAPVLSHGRLYVRGKDLLVCLELIPGKNGK